MKKLFSLLISVILILTILSALSACKKDPQHSDDPAPSDSVSDSQSGSDQPAVDPGIDITVGDLRKYVLIVNETSDEEYNAQVSALYNSFNQCFGGFFELKSDYIVEGSDYYKEGELEVLIGSCNRRAYEEIQKEKNIRINDTGYAVYGKKIIIFGTTAEAVGESVKLFTENILSKVSDDDTAVVINSVSDFVLNRATYSVDDFKLNGHPISDYLIVYPSENRQNERGIAEWLRQYISDNCGIKLKVISDKNIDEGKSEIHVGATKKSAEEIAKLSLKDNEYIIRAIDGDTVMVHSGSIAGLVSAIAGFKADLEEAAQGQKVLEMTLAEPIRAVFAEDAIKVMSFNVLTAYPDYDRKMRVVNMVLENAPDIIGMQESALHWMQMFVMPEHSGVFSSIYDVVGEGRDGGSSGEFNPIYYRKDRFTLLDSGTKWLTETPDVVSRYEGSSYNRIFTYAILKDKLTEKTFVAINTHLEHTNSASREYQIASFLKYITETKPFLNDYDIILTGDFNCNSAAKPIKELNNVGFVSTSTVAIKTDNGGTYHGYKDKSSVIDFIFTKGDAIVYEYEVLDYKINGDYASDHHPIISLIEWLR